MMKVRILLATTALVAATTASTANAQTTNPRPRPKAVRTPATSSAVQTKPGVVRKGTGRKPAAVPAAAPRAVARPLARRAGASTNSPFIDPTGRKDLSGRSVSFYPSARKPDGIRSQAQAQVPRATSARRRGR